MRLREMRRMIDTLRRTSTVMAVIVWILASAKPLGAAPTHARNGFIATPARAGSRAFHPALTFHVAPVSFTHRSQPLSATSALPGLTTASPVHRFAARVPVLAIASLVAPLDWDGCADRARTLLTTLPATPFVPLACDRASSGPAGSPDGLVAGRNKNALYGPAYAPRVDDQP